MTEILVVTFVVVLVVAAGLLQRQGPVRSSSCSTSCGSDPSCDGCELASPESDHVQAR